MKNKIILVFAVLGVLSIPLSCSKNFLDTTNTQGISSSTLFHTPQDGISLVNAIYDGFQPR